MSSFLWWVSIGTVSVLFLWALSGKLVAWVQRRRAEQAAEEARKDYVMLRCGDSTGQFFCKRHCWQSLDGTWFVNNGSNPPACLDDADWRPLTPRVLDYYNTKRTEAPKP